MKKYNESENNDILKNDNHPKKRKKTVLIIISIIAIILLIGSSYAIWTFTSVGGQNLIQSNSVELEFLESSSEIINITNAFPMEDNEGKIQPETFDFQVKTKTNADMRIKYSLYIEKLQADSGYTFLEDTQVKVYLKNFSGDELVMPKKISDLNEYLLYSDANIHNSENEEQKDKFKLRVWIDKNVDATDWDQNTKIQYKFKIGVKATQTEINNCNEVSIISIGDTSNANAPVLSDNMIPVYYDTCEEVWRKADKNNEDSRYVWYDYDNKIWANSVTVSTNSEGVRTDLTEAPEGTPIPMDRILTMQVWVPRYKYTVWNYNSDGTATSEPQQINIEFESGTTTSGEIACTDLENMGTSDETKNGTQKTSSETCIIKATSATCTDSTCNGKTYTHPAFTFGDKELEGIWAGKFEVSSDTRCGASSSSAIGERCNLPTIRPLVKPNVTSWRGAMVGTFENNIMAMNDSSNMYGFLTTDDTHMMKNMEWGAVVYLSNSKYGINKEININNSSEYYTGRSGGNVGGSTPINGTYTDQTSTTKYNAYGFYTYDGYLLEYGTNTKSETRDLSKVASTTGNIYGIYDMSGGARDYVMGNVVSPDGTTMMSGDRASNNNYSGYTGIVYYGSSSGDYTSVTGTYEYPDNKYYDKYSFNTSSSTRGRSKLGDAIKEVYASSYGWYSDYSSLAYSYSHWFARGGESSNGSSVGVFNSSNNQGSALTSSTSRLVISQTN